MYNKNSSQSKKLNTNIWNLVQKRVILPLLKCLNQSEGKELLQEIHSEECGSHIDPRALSAKAIRQGFYWPTHIKDEEQIVKTCEACQTTYPHQSKPSAVVQHIPPTRSLQRWGIDLVGPLPPSQGEQVRNSSNWVLHKMDWIQDTSNNHFRK